MVINNFKNVELRANIEKTELIDTQLSTMQFNNKRCYLSI